METILESEGYSIIKENDLYFIKHSEEFLETPAKHRVETAHLKIAQYLLKDWQELGYESYISSWSSLCYQFTLIDNVGQMSHQGLLEIIDEFNWDKDASLHMIQDTEDPDADENFIEYFGIENERIDNIEQWLDNCTNMQLTAIICIYNAYFSMNIPYMMAKICELYRQDVEEKIDELIQLHSFLDPTIDADTFWERFIRFALYYSIDYNKLGKHIPEDA